MFHVYLAQPNTETLEQQKQLCCSFSLFFNLQCLIGRNDAMSAPEPIVSGKRSLEAF